MRRSVASLQNVGFPSSDLTREAGRIENSFQVAQSTIRGDTAIRSRRTSWPLGERQVDTSDGMRLKGVPFKVPSSRSAREERRLNGNLTLGGRGGSNKFFQVFSGNARELRHFKNLENMDAALHNIFYKGHRKTRKLVCNAYPAIFLSTTGAAWIPAVC